MTEIMRAVVLTGHGDIDKLEYRENHPKPVAGPGEVLIKVHACGMNNTDVNTRTAWYSKGTSEGTTGGALEGADGDDGSWGGAGITFPRVQGADVAGTVEAVGEGVNDGLIGKRVMIEPWLRDWDDPANMDQTGYYGSECDGGYAEYTKIDARHVHPVNSNLSHAEIATFATSYLTAEGMLVRAGVGEGDTVLITGASGGVGSALIQLANRRGARTVAMSSDAKADAVKAVGPAAVISRAPDDLAAALKGAIGNDTVTVVADVVGGPYWPQLIDVLARGGRYVTSGAIAGPMVELDLRTLYLRDLTFHGSTVLPPELFADLVGYIERGEIKPLLAKTYPLEKFHAGQRAFMEKTHIGNIVVTID